VKDGSGKQTSDGQEPCRHAALDAHASAHSKLDNWVIKDSTKLSYQTEKHHENFKENVEQSKNI
jgi:hypothetical protein